MQIGRWSKAKLFSKECIDLQEYDYITGSKNTRDTLGFVTLWADGLWRVVIGNSCKNLPIKGVRCQSKKIAKIVLMMFIK